MSLASQSFAAARFLARDPVRSAPAGVTRHAVLHRQNKAALRYFAPVGEARRAPLFVCMPLINHWYIWDLLPGRSVVEALTQAGTPVYLLDWGAPGAEDAQTTLDQLLNGTLHRALDRARRHARATHGDHGGLDLAGYCVGGTFLALYLALHPEAGRRACFVATPIDFHASGRLARWASPETFPVDEAVRGFGNYPGRIIQDAFAWLKPAGQTRKWVGLWERSEDEGFLELWAALERWSGDAMDFPGEAYREYVRRCYFENALMHADNCWRIGGRDVTLSAVNMPAHVIAATRDHVVEPPAAEALSQVWGGEVSAQRLRGGHVGICVGGELAEALVDWSAP